MKKNLIILTSGLSGSSVLAGLLARGGWWVGDETFKKADYDTFENARLIEQNKRLFAQVDYQGHYEMVFDPAEIKLFAGIGQGVDASPYKAFLDECDAHSPWLWKDPRLWLTIHYWQDLIDFNRVRFINLTRDPLQAWISLTNRRQIQEYGYLKDYLLGIQSSIQRFLQENPAEFVELEYEQLLLRPEYTIERLNTFLGATLDISDLRAVYKGRLLKKPKGTVDLLKACFIYAKNYRQRYH